VNFLRDNPMTQFSIRWILSLNRLSQKWGQVQTMSLRQRQEVQKVLWRMIAESPSPALHRDLGRLRACSSSVGCLRELWSDPII